VLEDVDAISNWAHEHGALVIAVVNPLSLALLKAPGQWGDGGADIACGEGQPLGVPLSSGGPYYGFMCCKQAYVRQMPGRIVGRTVDLDGKPGYALTLQAREQHIRRSKATSNICTNQGLMVTASTIHMAIVGAEGLKRVAAQSHANTNALVERLTAIDGVKKAFASPAFHETVLQLELPVADVLKSLAANNVLGGYNLGEHYPELGNAILVCATETKTAADIEAYASELEGIFKIQASA
jgi:glycine dehydrogenase subunit 1